MSEVVGVSVRETAKSSVAVSKSIGTWSNGFIETSAGLSKIVSMTVPEIFVVLPFELSQFSDVG